MADTETLTDPNLPAESAPAPSGGTIAPGGDWRAALTDESLRREPALGKYKTVDDAARGFLEAQKLTGDAIKIPKPDATPEERAAFHRKLGVPESPDKYEVKLPELPEGHPTWAPEKVAGAKALAHQLGWTPAQLQGAIEWFAKDSVQSRDTMTAAQARDQQARQDQTIGKLEQKWKTTKDSLAWNRNIAIAKQAVRSYLSDDPELAQEAELKGNNPSFVALMQRLGEQNLEDLYRDGETPGVEIDEDARSRQVADITKELAAMNQGHPRYAELLAQKDRLYMMKHGGRPL